MTINDLFFGYQFVHPHWLWLLLLLPFVFWLLGKQHSKGVRFTSSRDVSQMQDFAVTWPKKLKTVLRIGKTLALGCLIIALAGPYTWEDEEGVEDYKKGIDMILAIDVSLSMFTRDFEPHRLAASKRVAKEFVSGRKADRIGLVVYAGEAYTACPSTLDYDVLIEQIDQITGEYIEGGTAIGVGLGTAVSRLRSDSLSTKVVILLTDGSNNAGEISPQMAAELAAAKKVRVYTIGVGSDGEALSPVVTPFGIRFENMPVEIDEETLKLIAEKTGGKYFRATDAKKLSEVYREIDAIEKKKFVDQVYQGEPPADPTNFLLLAICAGLLFWVVERIVFEKGYA